MALAVYPLVCFHFLAHPLPHHFPLRGCRCYLGVLLLVPHVRFHTGIGEKWVLTIPEFSFVSAFTAT